MSFNVLFLLAIPFMILIGTVIENVLLWRKMNRSPQEKQLEQLKTMVSGNRMLMLTTAFFAILPVALSLNTGDVELITMVGLIGALIATFSLLLHRIFMILERSLYREET